MVGVIHTPSEYEGKRSGLLRKLFKTKHPTVLIDPTGDSY